MKLLLLRLTITKRKPPIFSASFGLANWSATLSGGENLPDMVAYVGMLLKVAGFMYRVSVLFIAARQF